jgi:hypothetical protein
MLERLLSDDRSIRIQTREEIEQIGIDIIPHLGEILYFDNHKLRWEAAKTLEQMAYVEGIDIQLQALEDEESDIRWIAAEGLVKLGRKSILPILKKIVNDGTESVFFIKGAYHVLQKLDIEEDLKEKLKPIVKALNKKKLIHTEVPKLANELLHEFEE